MTRGPRPERRARPNQRNVTTKVGGVVLLRLVTALLAVLGSVTLAGPAGAQPSSTTNAPTAPEFLKLTLDSVSPTAVTANSDPLLTVSGTVTNIGNRVVKDIIIRLQRGAAISTPANLRATLRYDQVNFDIPAPWEDISNELSPGQRQQFTLSVPLRGKPNQSLEITKPGVYPLLLNVNGQPDFGLPARLDDARFLLPVLGLPPTPDSSDPGPVLPPTDAPIATTMIWPLADRPRMVGGQLGTVDRHVELTDDELAASFGKGGRLDQLLGALESVVGSNTGRDRPAVANAICIAIDPDLVRTAQAMIKGYRVLASPSDPGGPTRPGTGADAAQAWLDRLRALAESMCTIALPFAQVDPSALAAVNDPDLSAEALNAPADIVDEALGVRSLRGVSLPDSGSIDTGAGMLLRGRGFGTTVLADSAVTAVGDPSTKDTSASAGSGHGSGTASPAASQSVVETGTPDMVRLPDITGPAAHPDTPATPPADPALRAATFDIWSATALAAIGSNPPTPSFTPAKVRYDVAADSRAARLQDALGAVSWAALNPQPNHPRTLLLMPPQQWGANRDEAITLLRHLDLMIHGNLATARPFTELLATPPDPQPYELDYLHRAQQDAVPGGFVLPVRDQAARITDLQRALLDVPEAKPTPHDYLTPLRDDLIRALTLSDRRTGDTAQPDTFAQRRIAQTTRALDDLYGGVTVLPPGGVYTLATEQSPLLLVVRNKLPVTVRVKFKITAPPETKITDLPEQQLPPNSTRSFQIPTEVTYSTSLRIPISLTTPDGIALGAPTEVSVRSNAYGQAFAIITACAGILLFLLVGRRLWRRFRGQPDPADEGVDPSTQRRVYRYWRARNRVLQQEQEHQEV